jgi:hypothetical protein
MTNIPRQFVNALTPLAQKLGLAITQIFGWYVRATFIRGIFFFATLHSAILDIFVPQYGAFHEILRQIGR